MPLNRPMCRLILIISIWGNQNRSHHGKRTEGRGNHIAHYIPVIILARPDITALRLHHPRHGIINQRIEISNSRRLEFLFIFRFKNLLKKIFKSMVILLRNRILSRKPEILLNIQRIIKAASRKALNGRFYIMLSLNNARTVKFKNRLFRLRTVRCRKYQLRFSGSGYFHFHIFIYIPISVPGNGNRFFPVFDTWFYSFYFNRRTEHRTVQNRPDRTVGTFPHLF